MKESLMREAINLAEQGLFTTAPNPRVGCVVVKAGEIIGRGYHARAGSEHAEVIALQEAGQSAEGSTLYVTLEPCAHQGKTPPCANAVIEAGVAKVVAAMQDPNPQVAGKGFERLVAAGIEVEQGVCQEEAETLNPGFCKRMRHGTPFIRSKIAMSLDGKIAMASGESQWITGPSARQEVQYWRARSSVVLTGIDTVLKDNPRLSVRHYSDTKPPLRVVLDSQGRFPANARMLEEDGPILIATTEDGRAALSALEETVDIITLPKTDSGQITLDALFKTLANDYEANEVLVEAGGTLNGALLEGDWVDEYLLYVAPKILGNKSQSAWNWSIEQLTEHKGFVFVDSTIVGDDLRLQLINQKNRYHS